MTTIVSFEGKPIRINARKDRLEYSYDGGHNWSEVVTNHNAYGELTDIQINGSTVTATFETRDYVTLATTQISSDSHRLRGSYFKRLSYTAKN